MDPNGLSMPSAGRFGDLFLLPATSQTVPRRLPPDMNKDTKASESKRRRNAAFFLLIWAKRGNTFAMDESFNNAVCWKQQLSCRKCGLAVLFSGTRVAPRLQAVMLRE